LKKKSGKKFQQEKFKSVEEFLESLSGDELKIVTRLRAIIFECAPEISEKLSYNVPFYKMRKGLFFIWPSSIKWGKENSWTGVRFGFQKGYMLNDELNYLEKGNRKFVYYKTFHSVKEIDAHTLKSYIYAALITDKILAKKHGASEGDVQ
jgi:hypothetical protein